VRFLALILAAGFVLSACGEAPRPTAEPRVKLELALPDDGGTVREDRIEVRGTVTPGDAAVQVAGSEAKVDAGEFHAEVRLEVGGNVIDVTASAPGRRPATDAVRVERDDRVQIPILVGQEVGEATALLARSGLEAQEERGGSWIDRVLGGPAAVCTTEPPEGTLVQPRSTVTLLTGRDC